MEDLIEKSWHLVLNSEFKKPYYQALKASIALAYKKDSVFPEYANIFKAFELCPFDNVKVVILGQDPYHQKGQAMGLSFSVESLAKLPPSLRNIYKELASDVFVVRKDGDLRDWAKQGVLLLNSTLTVNEARPGSHQGLGWEIFTDLVISLTSQKKEGLVFVLWGKFAQAKKVLIDETKHLVIEAPHPSPFSAHRGFLGSKPFSQINKYLKETNQSSIDW
jgi:uracil-DNA glycosylase